MGLSIDDRTGYQRVVSGSSKIASGSNAEDKKLKEACKEFESVLFSQMMKGLRSTVQKSDLFGSDREEEMFQDMMDQELCKSAAHSQGLGIAELLYQQFTVNHAGKTIKSAGNMVEKYSEPIREGE